METEEGQQTDALYRVIHCPNNYRTLQVFSAVKNEWASMYTIRYEEASPNDLELSNWWACTHADALWCTCLFVARLIDGERHSIFNAGYKVHRIKDGSSTVRNIDSAEEWLRLVTSVFGIPEENFLDQDQMRQGVEKFLDKNRRSTF